MSSSEAPVASSPGSSSEAPVAASSGSSLAIESVEELIVVESASALQRTTGSSKYELLKEMLWPDEERLRQFEGLAGVPPDERVIFRSNTFYKLWSSLPEGGALTEKDKRFLLASAVTAQTAGRIVIDFKRRCQSLGDEGPTKVAGKKRKHSPEADEVEDEGEDDAITVDNIQDFEMVPRTITFAAVAANTNTKKARPKTQSEHLLHVFKSADERLPISREEFGQIEQSLMRSLKLSLLEDNVTEYPLVDWMAFGSNVGLVAAEDSLSMLILKDMIKKISLEGNVFRGWEKEEMYSTLSVRLPASLRDADEFSDDFILLAMRKLNPVLQRAEYFSHVETLIVQPKESPNEFLPADFRVYKFKVDNATLDKIRDAGGKLHVVAAKVTVNKGREPLCRDN